MQSVACALDILQAENKQLPGLSASDTVDKVEIAHRRPTVKLADPLVDAILVGLVTRFAGYSEREDLILASVTLPQFRLRWLDEVKKRTRTWHMPSCRPTNLLTEWNRQ